MENDSLVTTASLNGFFYKKLCLKNKQVTCPLPEEFLFYSSLVLERYALSDIFFTEKSGKLNEKILGIKLLESHSKPKEIKVNELKDVGDTVLVQLGFFADSVKKKITTKNYYLSLAQNAYQELNVLDSQFYDIPNFYQLFASSLNRTITLLEVVAGEFHSSGENDYLLNLELINKKAI